LRCAHPERYGMNRFVPIIMGVLFALLAALAAWLFADLPLF